MSDNPGEFFSVIFQEILGRPLTSVEQQKFKEVSSRPSFKQDLQDRFPNGPSDLNPTSVAQYLTEIINAPNTSLSAAVTSSAQNPYGGLPMDQAAFNRYGSAVLNPIMNLLDPLNVPASITNNRIQAATQTMSVTAPPSGLQPQVYVRDQYNPNRKPIDEGRLQKAIVTCESVKTANCSAFDNPEFAMNCVIAHEPGTNSKGERQIGGFVLFEEDRVSQEQAAAAQGRAPAYVATVGTLPIGKVSVNKKSCIAMTEAIACARGKNFNLANCASCQDGSESWYRVTQSAVRENGRLVFSGTVGATYRFIDPSGVTKEGTFSQQSKTIELPPDAEGKTFRLIVAGDQIELFVAGLLEGPTVSGISTIDLAFITTYDTIAGAKPRFIGSIDIRNGEAVNKIRAGVGKNALDLQIYIPYTYLAKTEEAANQCAGAPFITQEKSAMLLSSDPCFKTRGPGSYNMQCLQDRFISAGCTANGEAYPNTEEKADKLRTFGGQPQEIGMITQRISNMSDISATGRNPANGAKLTIQEWDAISRQCTGKRIMSPCDADPATGPLGNDCLNHLYNNGGAGKSDGATYTLPTNSYSSLTPTGFPKQCTPAGLASPLRPDAAAAARAKGSVANVKQYYDNIHRRANDNTLSDADRKIAVDQCYGINFVPDNRQVGGPTRLASGSNTSFRGAIDNGFLRHKGFMLRKDTYDGSDLNRQDGTFKQAAPLCGLPGFVSLQSVNYPNHYIVNEGDKGVIRPRQKTTDYEDRACWKMNSCGLGNTQFENKAGRVLISRGADIFVTSPANAGPDNVNACWQTVKPLTSKDIQTLTFPAAKLLGSNSAITNDCPIPGFDTLKDVNEAIRRCQAIPDCTHINWYGQPDMGPNNVVYRNCKGIDPTFRQLSGWTPYQVKPNQLRQTM